MDKMGMTSFYCFLDSAKIMARIEARAEHNVFDFETSSFAIQFGPQRSIVI